ncbi:response regulator transcription factor [Nocardiopsis sp. HNM0947]|uniref:Response regulator transcription factor n=1 Tax=Nocardiopsis coralli TaxID=2772213 RepID=A0ABR9P4P3_9ACTN|nr:response regulator transcription factor [Nocardiopsis coralli]MBE2998782.1 response regulator transcription factor [Nocardiopsis coralli]
MTAVTVVVVDDQALMRQGLRKLLEIEPGIDVVGEAADGVEALDVLAELPEPPDVALVDARMPRMDGVELIRHLQGTHPGVRAIVLTTFDEDGTVLDGLRAGARGHLLKDVPPEELVQAVHRVAAGQTVLGGPATAHLVAALPGAATTEPNPEPDDPLSDREREVALRVGEGATNREIARALFITEGTAKNHVTSALRKLDLRDRTQLALWVRQRRRAGG